MNNDKISIIIPIYNCQDYIKKMMKSVLNQSYKNIEVILINDGSTDKSYEECKRIKDSRIVIVNKENGGVSSARNAGINASTGKYITFIDPDDWVEENYIEYMYKKILEYNVDIVAVGYYKEKSGKSEKMLNFEDIILESKEALDMSSRYFFSSIWGKLFKKSLINKFKELFDEDLYYSEDTLAYCKLLKVADKVFWTSTPLYHYFINEKGAMKSKNAEKYFSDYIARKKIEELVKFDLALYNIAKIKTTKSAVNILLWYKLVKYFDLEKIQCLRRCISENKNLYLKSDKVDFKDKILYKAIDNKFYYLLYWAKNRK